MAPSQRLPLLSKTTHNVSQDSRRHTRDKNPALPLAVGVVLLERVAFCALGPAVTSNVAQSARKKVVKQTDYSEGALLSHFLPHFLPCGFFFLSFSL